MHESRAAHGVYESLVALARKWRVIAPFAVVTPLVVLALSARTPATYESSADVLLERKGQAISGLRELDWYYFDASRAIRTQAELARLPEISAGVEEAAEREGLPLSGGLGQSFVTEDGVTDLMTFHVRHGDPELAMRLATLYAEQYVAHRRALDTRALRRAIGVVDSQLARLRAEEADPSTHADLIQKQQQLNTGLATIASNARVVRPAVEAVHVAPVPWRSALGALVLGLIVGIGLAALANTLDSRARTADEISEQLGIPVLGRLPLTSEGARSSTALGLVQGDESTNAEAISLLRANLALEGLKRERTVLLVTSSVSGEGKSTTAAKLAVALALAGRDVVLVDLDLRQPTVWSSFDVPKAPGIVELARGTSDLAAVAHLIPLGTPRDGDETTGADARPASRGTLRVVPAGNALTTDAETIVASATLPAAIETLRELADVVLVDGPPLLETGVSLALSSYVDELLFVASTRRYTHDYTRAVRRLLARAPATVVGLVVLGEPERLQGHTVPSGFRRRSANPTRLARGI